MWRLETRPSCGEWLGEVERVRKAHSIHALLDHLAVEIPSPAHSSTREEDQLSPAADYPCCRRGSHRPVSVVPVCVAAGEARVHQEVVESAGQRSLASHSGSRGMGLGCAGHDAGVVVPSSGWSSSWLLVAQVPDEQAVHLVAQR